jgi:signal transduction histidine kinase
MDTDSGQMNRGSTNLNPETDLKFDVNWFGRRRDERGWDFSDKELLNPDKRDSILYAMTWVTTRATDNRILADHNADLLKTVFGSGLEARLYILDNEEMSFASPVSDALLDDPGLVHLLLDNQSLMMRGPKILYLLPLAGKLQTSKDLGFPKNPKNIVGALAMDNSDFLSQSAMVLLDEYSRDLGTKIHLKKQRDELSRLADWRRDSIRYIGHNLRNWVIALKSKTLLVKRGRHGRVPKHLAQPLEMLDNLVDGLDLNLQRYLRSTHEGRLVFTPDETDLKRDIVDKVLGLYTRQLEDHGVEFIELPETSFSYGKIVRCDPVNMVEVYNQLLNNVINHAEPGCRLAIGYAENEKYHILHNWNSGKHIPEGTLKSLKESDSEVMNVTPTDKVGFGVGLKYVKAIANQHDGYIEIENTGTEGQSDSGVLIRFYIPKNLPA